MTKTATPPTQTTTSGLETLDATKEINEFVHDVMGADIKSAADFNKVLVRIAQTHQVTIGPVIRRAWQERLERYKNTVSVDTPAYREFARLSKLDFS